MEDRVALRGSHEAPRPGGYGASERDESEEEKVYYGFGVFMGLPLADLRAMKEEYLQKQGQLDGGLPVGRGNSIGNGAMMPSAGPPVVPMRGPPVPVGVGVGGGGGGPPPGVYGEYEVRDPMGRSHGMVRGGHDGRGGGGGAPLPPQSAREMDPRMMAAGGGGGMMMHPRHQQQQHHAQQRHLQHQQQHYVGGGGGHYAGGGVPGNGHHSDDGESSDGSYSAPKSHSLNFILH